jgi:HEAT repeat protein
MSTNSDGSLKSGTDAPKGAQQFQTRVRTLIVLVACCAAILWAWRHWSENNDPEVSEARSIQKKAIGALQSGKTSERMTAIVELERLGHGDRSIAIHPLIGVLEDPVIEVRVAAAEALSSIGSSVVRSGSAGETIRAAALALIRCLNDPDKAVRGAAVKALGSIGSSVVRSGSGGETVRASATALIQRFKDPEPGVRSAAATALEEMALPRVASMAAPPIDRKAVMDRLVEMLGDRDAGVRRAVINAIASHPSGSNPPDALARGLKDESAENRAAAVGGLTFFERGLDPWLPILLRLAEHDPDPSVRERCFTTLSYAFKPPGVTSAVVPVLTASLRSEDARVRSEAASLLGVFKADARAAIPELLRILNEPLDPQVVPVRGPSATFDPACAAASALGWIAPGSAEAKEVIAALMEVGRSAPLSRRGWAAVALGEFGPAAEEAVPVLIKVLSEATPDDQFEREASAAVALGKIAPDTRSADQAVAALLPVLQSKVWLSRAKAIEALRQFGPKAAAAIPRIRALKDDRNAEVRDAAAKALLAIKNDTAP